MNGEEPIAPSSPNADTPRGSEGSEEEVVRVAPRALLEQDERSAVRAFLIADIRGYSTFTRERGHEEAAKLAARFVDLATDAVEGRGGRVVEIRGDEVLAVFASAVAATRAGVDLQFACAEESDSQAAVPAGAGIDVGESVRSGAQYHSSHLNMAARLCSRALAGEVLVTRNVADVCRDAGDLIFEERGSAEFKGFDCPVDILAVTARRVMEPLTAALVLEPSPLPPELDTLMPMVGRDRELHWLRGTWRQVRRGHGRLVFVSGPTQIGKTRLAAELAEHVRRLGASVAYAGPGGTAAADALSALRGVLAPTDPTLLVLDSVDAAGEAPVRALAEVQASIDRRPVMVVCLMQDPHGDPDVAAILNRADGDRSGHRSLEPLDRHEIETIARLYGGEDLADTCPSSRSSGRPRASPGGFTRS